MDRTLRTWAEEVLEVIEDRRSVVLSTAIAVVVVGVALTFVLPDLLPPRAPVGAAVGFAAVVLGVAAALARDAVDDTVRGTRHVRAAGGEPLAVLPGAPDPDTLTELADRVAAATSHGSFRLALSPVSRQISTVPRWGRALAVELSRRELRVVSVDLGSGPARDGEPGVLEVVRDGVRLGDAVTFDPELLLAELGPGADDDEAVAAWPRLANQLPSDIDVVVLSLPAVTRPGVLQSLGTAHQAWLFAASDRTARVDLIAGLDAADRTDTPTGVVLLAPDQEQPAPAHVEGVASADPDPEASAPASGPAPGTSAREAPAPAEPTAAASPIAGPEASPAASMAAEAVDDADLQSAHREEVDTHATDEVVADAEVAPHEHRDAPLDADPEERDPEDAPRVEEGALPPPPTDLMVEPGESDPAGLSVAQTGALDERGIPPRPDEPAAGAEPEPEPELAPGPEPADEPEDRDDTVDLGDLGISAGHTVPDEPRPEQRPTQPMTPPAAERDPHAPERDLGPARSRDEDERPTFLVEPVEPDGPEDPVRVAASLHAFADDLFDRD